MTLAEWLAVGNFLIILLGVLGGWIVLRSAIAKSESEVQSRVREALHDENELLRGRIQRLETENKRLSKIMQLLVATLKQLYGIQLDIEEDVITLRNANGGVSRVSTDI